MGSVMEPNLMLYINPLPITATSHRTTCRHPGPRQGRDMRRCIVARIRRPRQELLRIVRVPRADNITKWEVKIEDLDGHRNEIQGRSAYLEPSVVAVRRAKKRNMLGKALRCKVQQEVYARLESFARLIQDSNERDELESQLEVGRDDAGRDELWWD